MAPKKRTNRSTGGRTAGRTGKPARRPSSKDTLRVLFSCAGRRVELIRAFRLAAEKIGITLVVDGADANPLSPALHVVDKAHHVPPVVSGRFCSALLSIVTRRRIDLLVPLIDDELPCIATAAPRFAARGCTALISETPVIDTCRDKLATFAALLRAGIDTPATWRLRDVLKKKRHRFPYFLKPRFGSAAKGNYVIRDADELRVLGRRVDDAIVQEFVEGTEHTLDVYTGFDGTPRCVVPRKRIEVRSGEVSKGVIVKDEAIMAVGREVALALGPCRGMITVQCIVTPRERIRVIEINPRFGGGAPLSIHAGADFPKWILQELVGSPPRIRMDGFRNGIAMLRFDDSVFVRNAGRG